MTSPDTPAGLDAAVRRVVVGGVTRARLLADLSRHEIALNEAASALLADDRLQISAARREIEIVETSVLGLGFAVGATFAQLTERALQLGLQLCPLELAPFLRLQLLDQPEAAVQAAPTENRAPPGSLTIASAPLDDTYDTPNGFYLRKIDGVSWLRGYRCDAEHVWSPEDRLVYARDPQDE